LKGSKVIEVKKGEAGWHGNLSEGAGYRGGGLILAAAMKIHGHKALPGSNDSLLPQYKSRLIFVGTCMEVNTNAIIASSKLHAQVKPPYIYHSP
jgi:hypothetical protein